MVRRRWRVLVCCALASPVLLLAAAEAAPGSAFTIAMGVHAVSVLATTVAMFLAARRGDPRLRRARLWFSAALAASAAGFVVAGVHATLLGYAPLLSVANLSPAIWVPCALAGLFAIPSERHRQGGRVRAVLDGVVVTAALALPCWMLFLEPTYRLSERAGLAKAVLLAYPVADLVVAVACLAVAAHVRGDLRRFLHVVTAGLMLVVVSDAGAAAEVAAGTVGFSWTNVVLQAGLVLLLFAALLRTPSDLGGEESRLSALVDAVLPHAPVLLAVLVGLHQGLTGNPADAAAIVLGAIMVLGLVGRQLLYAGYLSVIAHRLTGEATRDGLTGLANRRSFLAALETSLAELDPGQVAVVLLDLDGFKEINDTFGHAAGDQALTGFARRLSDAADAGMPARLGGDEFALVVVGADVEVRAMHAADALTSGKPTRIGAVTVSVGASAGIAVNRPGDTTSELLRRADLAMYEAKRTHRSRAAVFTEDMAMRAERRHLLTQALPGAAGRGELEVVYQPVFRLDDGTVAGAEALLRWNSPLHGPVPPLEFISLAEETGAIVGIGSWVLSQAAQHVQDWADCGRPLPRLYVNVSPHQLTATFAADAVRLVGEHGVAPSTVTLEITESAMPDLHANRCLGQLREAGFRLAMDDFGAGYSSLAQLAALPVDTLKFDREFIRGVSTPNGRRIVDAIIALAGDLGLTTIAEGVETAAEADVVRQAGCELAQGYLFSRPLTVMDMWQLLDPAGRPAVPTPRPADTAPVAVTDLRLSGGPG